ncbi:zinc ribbon domain-containing protein [Plantactinospora sp. CA-294935]|uniref:zinc ribbon domain-containing protein n=1 Tax=Plantactinospora sp. CA-294935 TaxID=3240012 RepID=UPI003D92A342
MRPEGLQPGPAGPYRGVGPAAGTDHLQRHQRKLCSTCGVLAERKPLDVRTWTCRCGTIHDRDVNAARNILAEGLSVTACGAGVRPQRADARTRQSVSKQENPRATKGIPAL